MFWVVDQCSDCRVVSMCYICSISVQAEEREERFKAIELIKSDIRGDRSDTCHTFARHHMYNPNKNNMGVPTLYTIQRSKCSKYLV